LEVLYKDREELKPLRNWLIILTSFDKNHIGKLCQRWESVNWNYLSGWETARGEIL